MVELGSGKVVGAEALARWRHPTRGILGPEVFLPPLARAGYLDELSWIMLSMAAMEAGLWRRADLRMTVSVNVSATSLADPGYADAVTQIVTGHGLDPSEMILELTETEAILNIAAALENLTRLRIKGFGLAIDDYGVGYSSMQALSRMPFTEIKIDRSFVAAAASDPKYRLMVEHTIAVAHQLGLKTVAEGVETRTECDLLASLGCDRIQGYLISKPVEGSGFLRWMLDRRAKLGPDALKRPKRTLEADGHLKPARRLSDRSAVGASVCACYTRRRYSPLRVSISMRSPVVTNSGTWISTPFASFAGFITLPDVSPLTAGSVYFTSRTTEFGSSTEIALPS